MIVVDLSKWQGGTPPLKALRDQHGVGGVIIQFNDGAGVLNPYAAAQYRAAKSLGLQTGAYLFAESSQTVASQIHETLVLVERVGGMDDGAHVFVDVEGQGGFNDPAHTRQFLIDAHVYIKANAPKYKMGAYAGDSMFRAMGCAQNGWNGMDVWVADYGVSQPNVMPYYGWQYTDSFAGAFDASIFPRGIISHPIPAPTGQMTHALWVVMLHFIQTHYAHALWAKVWHEMTGDPANAFQVLVNNGLA